MKHFADCTRDEQLQLSAALAHLKEEAIRYAHSEHAHQHSDLAYAARAFCDTLDEIGLKEYYRPTPLNVEPPVP